MNILVNNIFKDFQKSRINIENVRYISYFLILVVVDYFINLKVIMKYYFNIKKFKIIFRDIIRVCIIYIINCYGKINRNMNFEFFFLKRIIQVFSDFYKQYNSQMQ